MSRRARIKIDPDVGAHARTLHGPVLRSWIERQRSAYRQDCDGAAVLYSVSRPGRTRVTGELRLQLSLADRQWLRTYMGDLVEDGKPLLIYPDSTDLTRYSRCYVSGDEVEERYQRVFEGRSDLYWTIDLPVLVVSEVG